MNGKRPLTDNEVASIADGLQLRDRALFILGIYTGFRISELLSIRLSDVTLQNGAISEQVCIDKTRMKGSDARRSVPLNNVCKAALKEYLSTVSISTEERIFPMHRTTAHRILKRAIRARRIHEDRIATHSMRKTFAEKLKQKFGTDANGLLKIQLAMGHKNINSTIRYLSVNQDEVWNAIKQMK